MEPTPPIPAPVRAFPPPPSGCTVIESANGCTLRASIVSARSWPGTVIVTLLWNGALGYFLWELAFRSSEVPARAAHHAAMTVLVLTLLFLVGVVLVAVTVFVRFGVIEVHINGQAGAIVRRVGRTSRRKRFRTSAVTVVRVIPLSASPIPDKTNTKTEQKHPRR